MSELKTKQRKALKAKQFAEPKQRKYPINDPAHARNAKARASEMYNKGKTSAAEKRRIDTAADKVLGKGNSKKKGAKKKR